MPLFTEGGGKLTKLAPFLKHLYSMLEGDVSEATILSWMNTGDGFVVLDKNRLCDEVCCSGRRCAEAQQAPRQQPIGGTLTQCFSAHTRHLLYRFCRIS